MDQKTKFKGESVHLAGAEKEVSAGVPYIKFTLQKMKNGKKSGRPEKVRIRTLARHDAVNALCACAAGLAFGVPLSESAKRLASVKGLKGRGEVLRSKKGAFIINDCYNASPTSVKAALETMAWWKGPMRGIAVLGDMAELGKHSKKYHQEIGEKAALSNLALLVTKGSYADDISKSAIKAGIKKDLVYSVDSNKQASKILKGKMKKGDWVLVKGSRSMKMEEITGEIMR
jgi:UDP-N-acetylmuramoyl-tripeptide--D-alanyl-D-alanine ligase